MPRQKKQRHLSEVKSNVTDMKSAGDPLADLVTRIKSLHSQVIENGKNVIRKAIDAGNALIDAKRQVGHGNWLKWLKENCELSDRTAEVYMTCARNRQRLETIIAAAANMTLAQALREIKPSKPDKGDGAMSKYNKASVPSSRNYRHWSQGMLKTLPRGRLQSCGRL